jgi:DNA polymerase I
MAGNGLLGALVHFGLDDIGVGAKEEMRRLVLSGGLWSVQERAAIIEYCENEVTALARLLPSKRK